MISIKILYQKKLNLLIHCLNKCPVKKFRKIKCSKKNFYQVNKDQPGQGRHFLATTLMIINSLEKRRISGKLIGDFWSILLIILLWWLWLTLACWSVLEVLFFCPLFVGLLLIISRMLKIWLLMLSNFWLWLLLWLCSQLSEDLLLTSLGKK